MSGAAASVIGGLGVPLAVIAITLALARKTPDLARHRREPRRQLLPVPESGTVVHIEPGGVGLVLPSRPLDARAKTFCVLLPTGSVRCCTSDDLRQVLEGTAAEWDLPTAPAALP